jgi:hypothetical protein
VDAEQLVEINKAAARIVREQFAYLVRRYGVDTRFRDGWGNHNATHALRVAWQGSRGVARLVESGEAAPNMVGLALIAGIFHDHVQTEASTYDLSQDRAALITVDERQAVLRHQLQRDGGPVQPGRYDLSPRRELLSIEAAHDMMRRYETDNGYAPAELFGSDGYEQVSGMIYATLVTGVTTDGIESVGTSARPEGAAMSDADKSDLALQGGLHRALLLGLERNQDRFPVPAFSDGSGLELDRDLTVPFLDFQIEIHDNDRFALRQSNELFPQRSSNGGQMRLLRREFGSGRWGWAEMLRHTAALARDEPVPPRGADSPLVTDPHDLIGDLAAGLRGKASDVPLSAPLFDRELQDVLRRAGIYPDSGIDFGRAVILEPPSQTDARGGVRRAGAAGDRHPGRGPEL